MTCSSCKHYLPGAFGLATYAADQEWPTAPTDTGICRRHPPRYFLPTEDSDGFSMFPSVHGTQVCGEFVAKRSEFQI